MTAIPASLPDPVPDRDEWLRRFAEIVSASLYVYVDWGKAARCLTEAFPPWRVFIGDQGGWYAGSPVPSPAGGDASGGETVYAATPEQMRDLLTARCGS
jgi:hypothetical protein